MQKRWILFGLVLSLVFNVAFLGALGYRLWTRKTKHIEQRERPDQRRGPSPFEQHLGLRKDQKEHLDKLRKDFFPRLREVRHQLGQQRDTLGVLLMQENPDTAQIVKRLNRIGKLQTRIEKELMVHMLQEKAFLDPPQQKIYLQMIMRRMGERGLGDRDNPRWDQSRRNESQPKKEQKP